MKAYNTSLQSKNKELEQFAYIASHDLQEPLLTVTNFTGLLDQRYKDKLDENSLRYLKYINEGAARMRQLLEGLLEYSRLGRELKLKLVDCKILVFEVLQEMNVTS